MTLTKNLDSDKFSELLRLVSDGLETEAQDWFLQNIGNNKVLEKNLVNRILNTPYFFSVRTFSHNPEFLDREKKRRELCVLNLLSLENQLKLFSSLAIEEPKIEHFSLLKVDGKTIKKIIGDKRISYTITNLFHNEEFLELEKIFNHFSHNFLDDKTNIAFFHYKEDHSHGLFSFNIVEEAFSPKFNIAVAYTDSKKEFLDKHGVLLPTVLEVEKVKELLLAAIESDAIGGRDSFKEKVVTLTKPYLAIKARLDLEDALPTKKTTSGLSKV